MHSQRKDEKFTALAQEAGLCVSECKVQEISNATWAIAVSHQPVGAPNDSFLSTKLCVSRSPQHMRVGI